MDYSDIVPELTRARIQLLLHWPLLGQIVLHLELQEAPWCPTAATDGKYFFYNPAFIVGLSRDELLFLTGHEVYHAVFEHMFRRGKRDRLIFNMAADFLVNHALVRDKVGKPIKGLLYDPQYSSDDYTTEELYNILEQLCVKIQMPLDMHLDCGGDDGDGDDEPACCDVAGPPVYTDEELESIRDALRSALIQGVQQQELKQPGSTPAGILRMVNALLQPTINWREMLQHVVRSAVKYDYTYARPSRRAFSSGIILPGADVMDRVEAVACLDGSASTTQEMITDFLSECAGIMGSFRDFKLTIMTFDTQVYNIMEFTPDNADDITRYDFRGGGGTMPICCWRYMQDHNIVPDQLVLFTDGEVGNDWGIPHYCDTLFIIHSNPRITAPYGRSTHYEPRNSR